MMKRILLYLFVAITLCSTDQLCGQESPKKLSFAEAEQLSGEHYRHAIQAYATEIDGDWQSGRLKSNGYQMPFAYSINGTMPEGGYPLYISLHGGGQAEAEVNDQQWENQKYLYGAVDGVYFVPRAPTDTWNMWHQEYMDDLLLQVVAYSIVRLSVDPSRIYLLGYSAGGDGVYNLASRLSDRFAAAAMMAGHPGDAQIENLRNLPFAIHVGEDDTAYNRAGLALEWLEAYKRLHQEDSGGFEYSVNIYGGKGHWMDGLDASAIGWLADHQRVGCSNRVVWIQDDLLHTRKYNLEVNEPKQGFRIEQVVDYENNRIYITSEHYSRVTIWLDDYIVDLEKPVTIIFNGDELFSGMVERNERNIIESINSRYDPQYVYWGRVTVESKIK